MGLLTNTIWKIHANNHDGELQLLENRDGTRTGSKMIFGGDSDDIIATSIQLTGNLISFTRSIAQNYIQVYSGTAVGFGGIDWSWTMMGVFIEVKDGVASMPYLWSTDPLVIPG